MLTRWWLIVASVGVWLLAPGRAPGQGECNHGVWCLTWSHWSLTLFSSRSSHSNAHLTLTFILHLSNTGFLHLRYAKPSRKKFVCLLLLGNRTPIMQENSVQSAILGYFVFAKNVQMLQWREWWSQLLTTSDLLLSMVLMLPRPKTKHFQRCWAAANNYQHESSDLQILRKFADSKMIITQLLLLSRKFFG